jgi:hypothetical protein
LSLLSKNDKPWFLNWGKICCYIHHTFLLGFPTGWSFTTHHLPTWFHMIGHKLAACLQGFDLLAPFDLWYVSNISIIFDVPCLFLHHLLMHFLELTY